MRQAGLRPTAPRASGPSPGDLEAAVESHCEAPHAHILGNLAGTAAGPHEAWAASQCNRGGVGRSAETLLPHAMRHDAHGAPPVRRQRRGEEGTGQRRQCEFSNPLRVGATRRSVRKFYEESEGGLVPSPGTWPATQDPGNERRGPPAEIPCHLFHLAREVRCAGPRAEAPTHPAHPRTDLEPQILKSRAPLR